MNEIAVSLWELSRSDLIQLPKGTQVLQYDTLFKEYAIKEIGKDFIPANLRFMFFAFDELKF